MLRNYLVLAYRNLLKRKLFSLINIVGLAIGIAACFLVLQFVSFELSYDRFQKDGDRIYRVTLESMLPSGGVFSATNHPGVGPALKAEFPEVLDYARVAPQDLFLGKESAWSYTDPRGNTTVFNEENVYNVDPSFVTLFSFPFILGEPSKAFQDLNSVVISRRISSKFFGKENPMGKVLHLNGWRPMTVTGVFENIPENSHINFDILISFFFQAPFGGVWKDEWDWVWPDFYTYILLAENIDARALQSKLHVITRKYRREDYEENLHLQPLTDIHLGSQHLTREREVRSNVEMLNFLIIVGFFILLIAWINYINLSTSRSIDRAREVGIRKLSGADRKQLIAQFLFESALLNLLASMLSILIIVLVIPQFIALTGKNIMAGLNLVDVLASAKFWSALGVVYVTGSFLAGMYPAFVLSGFKIVKVLKGRFAASRSGVYARRVLVGFQFSISIALMAGTLIVLGQVSYMRNQSLGYSKDQVLIVKAPRILDTTSYSRLHRFKTELKRNPRINNIGLSRQLPGNEIAQINDVRRFEASIDTKFPVYHFPIDLEFFDAYGMTLLAGRNFREDEGTVYSHAHVNPIILNEKAIRQLGFQTPDEAINEQITYGYGEGEWTGEIIGVVANHNQRSLKNDYDPIIFYTWEMFWGHYIAINVNKQAVSETVSFIEHEFHTTFGDHNPFDHFFLDDYFNRQYNADERFGRVFGVFSSLALLVASLGLLGLSTFTISQKGREIAVRKVLGAGVPGMIYLYSKDFIKLIIIANIVSLPFVYIMAEEWLNSFSFRTEVGWVTFLLPTIVLVIISLGAVSIQTTWTASTNPIKSLNVD